MSDTRKRRPVYTKEFRDQAVAKCLESGIKATSAELGVSQASLRKWKDKQEGSSSRPDGKPTYEELEKRLRKLERENGYIKEINEILKKSTAIFSNGELKGFK